MSEKTVIITEQDGKYQIQNNGISDFALIGILECLLAELKSANRRARESSEQTKVDTELPPRQEQDQLVAQNKETAPEPAAQSASPDLRTRIGNAVKAIKGLGGEAEHTDLTGLRDEELQAELDELTTQYKRLKSSKGSGK